MDKLVIFFSQTGKTRAVAEGIAEVLGASLEAITLPQGGKQISPLRGKWTEDDLPPVVCQVESLDPFQEIVLGGPVWAFNIAPPLLSFVQKMSWNGKKVILFVTEFGMGGRRALQTVEEALQKKGAQVTEAKIFTSIFKAPQRLKEQGKQWAQKMKK
ncbi:MAG: flavodoxin family protein [Candidatus Caldatribacteriaceae bacterium]